MAAPDASSPYVTDVARNGTGLGPEYDLKLLQRATILSLPRTTQFEPAIFELANSENGTIFGSSADVDNNYELQLCATRAIITT